MASPQPTVLIPTEFHPQSPVVHRVALNFCRRLNARAIFIHVVSETGLYSAWQSPLTPLMPLEVHYEWLARRQLETIKQFFQDNGVDCAFMVIRGGVAEEIQREIVELKPDLVIIGSKHRGAAAGFFGGTVERILEKTSCPVLIVPHNMEQSCSLSTPEPAEMAAPSP